MKRYDYCLVMTACDNEINANQLIEALLNEGLAACIQSKQINSAYVWKGKIEKESEVLLMIKTSENLYKKVEECILKNHTYELPEITCIPITKGYNKYLDWISEVTKNNNSE